MKDGKDLLKLVGAAIGISVGIITIGVAIAFLAPNDKQQNKQLLNQAVVQSEKENHETVNEYSDQWQKQRDDYTDTLATIFYQRDLTNSLYGVHYLKASDGSYSLIINSDYCSNTFLRTMFSSKPEVMKQMSYLYKDITCYKSFLNPYTLSIFEVTGSRTNINLK